MARPCEFSREMAVETAMNEIWREGYRASSVKALAEKLGITRSSFYNAFGSREALFEEVLALYLSQSPDRSLMLATPETPVRELFTQTFRDICRVRALDPEARGCLVVNGVAQSTKLDGDAHDRLRNMMGGSMDCIETIVGWGVKSGELDADIDVHATALAVSNLQAGINVLCKLVRNEADLWCIAETTLRGVNLLAPQSQEAKLS